MPARQITPRTWPRRLPARPAQPTPPTPGTRPPSGAFPAAGNRSSSATTPKDATAAISRAWSTFGTAVEAQREADDAQAAATTAAATTGARYSTITVGNRIEKLAADIRRLERRLTAPVYDPDTGYRPATEQEKTARTRHLEPLIAETRDQLAYWEGVRAEQVAAGAASDYGRYNVAKGDAVKIGDTWRRVVRANAKTVSVQTGYSWTDRAPWHSVTDHQPAADIPTEAAGRPVGR